MQTCECGRKLVVVFCSDLSNSYPRPKCRYEYICPNCGMQKRLVIELASYATHEKMYVI